MRPGSLLKALCLALALWLPMVSGALAREGGGEGACPAGAYCPATGTTANDCPPGN